MVAPYGSIIHEGGQKPMKTKKFFYRFATIKQVEKFVNKVNTCNIEWKTNCVVITYSK